MPSALATREKGVPLVNIAQPYNSQGMKRAWLTTDGEIGVQVFDQPA